MTTRNDVVAEQYEAWVYPEPIPDLAEAVAQDDHYDHSDPALYRRKLWPRKVEPESLDILVAGCGANQAAGLAFTNPGSRVVGIDVSRASLGHQLQLKKKHGLGNLQLHQLRLEEVASLERSFDLIICTGVLHHLPDPAAGLRMLSTVLRPHGVMSVMVYGFYPRAGVYMLQEAFRLLGLRQDQAGVEMVQHALGAVPAWHSIHSYEDVAPDLGYPSGLVDTFLHGRDRAYTVAQVLELVDECGLRFQGWLDNLDYAISAYVSDPQDPLRRAVEALPAVEHWRVVELLGQSLPQHSFLVCHADRPDADVVLNFTGDGWLDYVPALRRPIRILTGQQFSSTGAPPTSSTVVERSFQSVELDGLPAAALALVDGRRTVREILAADTLARWEPPRHLELARSFFYSMARWDHLQYAIP
jgi:SAM-dependent methyltransferase